MLTNDGVNRSALIRSFTRVTAVNVEQATTVRQREVSAPANRSAVHAVAPAAEGFTALDGRLMYCIPDFDELSPFLINVVSDSDLWMYVSSRGGLTAGRRSAKNALFGYETDDRLHHHHGVSGPITLLRDADARDADCWEPFNIANASASIQRRLYKSEFGNALVLEEIDEERELAFRYAWESCDEFGFVRTATLINRSPDDLRHIEILDGLLNIQPAGVDLEMFRGSSCLSDAFKVCEVDRDTRLAVYSLSSLITDKPHPVEALYANVVWCRGLSNYRIVLNAEQLRTFRGNQPVHSESKLRGLRGAFLVNSRLELKPGQAISWQIVGDVNRTQSQVSRLRRFLLDDRSPQRAVRGALDQSNEALKKLIGSQDGLQHSADRGATVHHFANTLFNAMRGGAFADGGLIVREDLVDFVVTHNRDLAAKWDLSSMPAQFSRAELIAAAGKIADASAIRLAHEYLPLTFGRRHGDPSRPWNQFEINLRDSAGRRRIAYQGNWRDIFQNWEAACLSYPQYLPSVIAKFVNASTVDGFNPYRISQDGIDWEAPEPENPSSNIGYWGDHQIVYLTRLLEHCQRFEPAALSSMMTQRIFSYADVPYRLRSHEKMLADCRRTIDFDTAADKRAKNRIASLGSDGRLLHDENGAIVHATLAEKLLVPVLAKLSSFVIDGGIWLNTQRPEWNDANNALAGHGLSVVTLCYLRRHIKLLRELFAAECASGFDIAGAVVTWMKNVTTALGQHSESSSRRATLDQLGRAFEMYRDEIYSRGIGSAQNVTIEPVDRLFEVSLKLIDRSLESNRRRDGLFHSYNLLHTDSAGEIEIERLPEMLEGQVAVLSSGILSAEQSLDVIDALFDSALYCPRRKSFILYPDRTTAGFLDRNRVGREAVANIPALAAMLAAGDESIVCEDVDGQHRFNAQLNNVDALKDAMNQLRQSRWAGAITRDSGAIVELYESVFNHRAFTGRSGAMFGYEGLGSIYWHMVAKLLVAVQEVYFAALNAGDNEATIARLAAAYERIRGGLGFNKSAAEFGAFPTDPYSHSPSHAGARQPGMTGQVKEEILTRFGELGLHVADGRLHFAPRLLSRHEFTNRPSAFEYVAMDGALRCIELPAQSIAFTYCQTPVVYRLDSAAPRIVLHRTGGKYEVINGDQLDVETSRHVFDRTGEITRIEVSVNEHLLRAKPAQLSRLQRDSESTVTVHAQRSAAAGDS